ncbi:transporter [Sphingobacteriaceae bacterium]|nr:transporter [Sphingobacteriaceae bacterium]
MSGFILIGLCIFAGILFRRRNLVPTDAHKTINAWIITIALPAVSFKYLTKITFTSELLIPALAPVLVFCGGLFFVKIIARSLKLDKRSYGAVQLTAGLSNTSFIGFPLIIAYFSEAEISIAIICDQVTFILFSVFGIIVAVRSSGKSSLSFKEILKRLFTFPPLVGCIIALSIPKSTNLSLVEPVFQMLAATVAPLALFSIGLQLSFKGWQEFIKPILSILTYKLFIAPALVLGLLLAFGLKGVPSKIAVFEAAMPVLLSVSILVDRYNLNPKLANLIIGVSIVLSFFTTWFWWIITMHFL